MSGRFDVERLHRALRVACLRHPIARARLGKAAATDTRWEWEIPEQPDYLSLELVEEPIEDVRPRFYSVAPALEVGPVFNAALVRGPENDTLMLNLHHTGFDGMSAVRLVTSIARAYSGVDDPTGGPELDQARDLRYQFATCRFSEQETAAILARKPQGCTVNDVVMGAHMMTILRWNREHAQKIGPGISVMMPVNMRPAEWSTEVVSNFASYLAIVARTDRLGSLEEAGLEVNRHTAPAKENGVAGWIVDILDRGNALPSVVKKNLQSFLPLVERNFVESTVFSNVGRMDLPSFGDAGEVVDVWFSPPCLSKVLPLALGLAGVGRELHAVFRSDGRSIGAAAVERYAEMFRETLCG